MGILSKKSSPSRIRDALNYIDPDERKTWLQMGMAIESELGDSGYHLWDEWSRQSDRYNERDARATWKLFKPGGGITIGTLFYFARENGWQHPTQIKRAKIPFRRANKPAPKKQSANDSRRKCLAFNNLWCQSMSICEPRAELARDYLKKRLGGDLEPLPNDLRFIESRNYWEDGRMIGHYPALIAVVRDPNGRPINLHQTYLQPDGSGKAPVAHPKKLMSCRDGTTVTGAAIRLYPPGETLALAEGIESALAFHVLHNVPVWACMSTHGVETVEVPSTVRHIIIAGDKDENFAGQRAALTLLTRLAPHNVDVKLKLPPNLGMDWCNVLFSQA